MSRTLRLGAIVGVAVAMTTVVATTPAAAAASPTATAITLAPSGVAARQIPLKQAAGLLRTLVEHGDYTGYAGLELEENGVALWWKGALPAEIARTVATARAIAPVRVAPADHSLAELRAAGTTLRAAYGETGTRIKYAVDGSKIVVALDATTTTVRKAAPAVGVPVDVVAGGTKTNVSRRDDWAPWKGGADQLVSGARCTTGFPVRNAANQRFILTAGHCGSNGATITDGTGEFMGTFTAKNETHDLGLVATPGNVDDFMYLGGLESNVGLNVEGWDWVYPGEYLCQSGGSSARDTGNAVCNLLVEKFNTNPGDAVEARQVNGAPAVRPGDSGGPVYAISASGNAIAKGINCYTYVGNNTILGFQDFGTATRDYGVWIAQ
jgi:streptogrisin D